MRDQPRNNRIDRRGFIRLGSLPWLGVGLPDLLAGEAVGNAVSRDAPAESVILVWLDGGPSTIDMWDLKPAADASIRGEFEPMVTSADGIQISEQLPKMAEQMQHVSLVRSLAHTVAEHDQGTRYVLTGNPISPSIDYPALGSIVAKHTSDHTSQGTASYIDLSGRDSVGAGYLGSANNPFVIDRFRSGRSSIPGQLFELSGDLTKADLDRRRKLLRGIERQFDRFNGTDRAAEMSLFQRRALDLLLSGTTQRALQIDEEDPKVRERYGSDTFGKSALAARRLIQAGVRFVTIGLSGWDTHQQNFSRLRSELLPVLDRGLSALIADLTSTGLLERTIVYCVGEFNRTPKINTTGGRDHWARSMTALVAGGGFKAGYAYGATDKEGAEPIEKPCSPADLNATILNQIGIAPDTKLRSRQGRPLPLFRDASILHELVS